MLATCLALAFSSRTAALSQPMVRASEPPEGPRGAPVAAAARRARDAKTPPGDEHGPGAAGVDAAAAPAAGAPLTTAAKATKAFKTRCRAATSTTRRPPPSSV